MWQTAYEVLADHPEAAAALVMTLVSALAYLAKDKLKTLISTLDEQGEMDEKLEKKIDDQTKHLDEKIEDVHRDLTKQLQEVDSESIQRDQRLRHWADDRFAPQSEVNTLRGEMRSGFDGIRNDLQRHLGPLQEQMQTIMKSLLKKGD